MHEDTVRYISENRVAFAKALARSRVNGRPWLEEDAGQRLMLRVDEMLTDGRLIVEESFKAYDIAAKVALEVLRDSRRLRYAIDIAMADLEEHFAPSAMEVSSGNEERVKVMSLLGELPDPLQMVIRMAILNDIPLRQIEETTGRSRSALSRDLQRGVGMLHKLMVRAGVVR